MSPSTHHWLTLASIGLSALGALPTAAQTVNEDIKIIASDAATSDGFGFSIAISDTTAIVGALRNDDEGTDSGSAYLFDTETWQQLNKLTASDAAASDLFGRSVDISGTTAIVGSPYDDDAGSFSGSAYLFDTKTGQELFKLTASDAAPLDEFGTSVAISGTIAIVGAFGNDDAGSSSGSAYLFDTKTGQQLCKLTASDAAENDRFGISVAISGTTAIVGAVRNGHPDHFSGSAYLFDTQTGDQIEHFARSDAAFGWSVAISGTMAIVGAYGDTHAGSNSGSAYLFDTETGQELFKLTASDAAPLDWFGDSVAISGTKAIVGARGDDSDDGNSSSGSAYIFDTKTGLQIEKLTASDPADYDDFGSSVAILGTTTIVGARGGGGTGSAYIFDTSTTCPPDLTSDGVLDFFDFSAFLTAFAAGNPAADFTGDGLFDFFDISTFLTEFTNGCS